ncbi:MAG: hypothetical protein IJC78_04195 [Clostridia bacterium]|nr:hypothetical protein [Clostridia bacterium]
MCKKLMILALMITCSMLTACSDFTISDMDVYERIHRYYSKMESYSATVHITAYSNKTQNEYIVYQKSVSPDRFYAKMSSPGMGLSVTAIEKNGLVKTFSEGSDSSVTLPSAEHTGLLFVNRFFAKYYASEHTVLTVSGKTDSAQTVLETELYENNPQVSRARLSVDNKTLAPTELLLTDSNGNPVLKGEFTEFCYNDTIDQSIFSAEE